MSGIKEVLIYTDYPSKALSIDSIIGYLERYRLKVSHKGNIYENLSIKGDSSFELAKRISGRIIDDIDIPFDRLRDSTNEEINSELDRLSGERSYSGVIMRGIGSREFITTSLQRINTQIDRPTL